MNVMMMCRGKPGLLFRAIKLLNVRSITLEDNLRYFMALLRFSLDLLIKGGEDKVHAVSYYIPGNKPLIVKLNEFNENIYLILRPGSGDAHDLLIGEYYEIFNWFYPNIKNSVFIDVGAHIGGYTVRACKKAKYVVAIEPQREVVDVLRNNVKINSCNNVQIIEKAVWSERRSIFMRVPKGDEQKAVVSHDGDLVVEADTLDNIISDLSIDKIDFLKIDIEGAEAEAIRGMEKALGITKYLMIELRPSTLWLVNTLIHSGYEIIDCVNHAPLLMFYLKIENENYCQY